MAKYYGVYAKQVADKGGFMVRVGTAVAHHGGFTLELDVPVSGKAELREMSFGEVKTWAELKGAHGDPCLGDVE